MRPAIFAHWSNGTSIIHTLDARVKLILLLAFVISLALLRSPSALQLLTCLVYLIGVAAAGRLPLLRVFSMSLAVIPFVGLFALIVYLTGDASRAYFILVKSYLSAASVLLCASTTTLAELLAAGRFFRIPILLLETSQLIYRYLFVLGGRARLMQIAFASRAGRPGRPALRAASGMVAVLFSRSYEKATMISHCMYSRGFSGLLVRYHFQAFHNRDIGTLITGLLLVTLVYFL